MNGHDYTNLHVLVIQKKCRVSWNLGQIKMRGPVIFEIVEICVLKRKLK